MWLDLILVLSLNRGISGEEEEGRGELMGKMFGVLEKYMVRYGVEVIKS
jgi:hypothetical protein